MIMYFTKNNLTRKKFFQHGTVDKLDLSGMVFRNKVFRVCTFINSNLYNLVFRNCTLENVIFDRCKVDQLKFSGCKMVSTSFRECRGSIKISDSYVIFFNFRQNTGVDKLVFQNSDLRNASFYGIMSRSARFIRCNLKSSSFNICDLTRATFENCKLLGASFSLCDFRDALFRYCSLRQGRIIMCRNLRPRMFDPIISGFDVCKKIPRSLVYQGFYATLMKHEIAVAKKVGLNLDTYLARNSIVFRRIWSSERTKFAILLAKYKGSNPKQLSSDQLSSMLRKLLDYQNSNPYTY